MLGRTMAAAYRSCAIRMVSYTTTWTMTEADIAKVVAAGEWNSWAFQVNVSGAGRKPTSTAVTWMKQAPLPTVALIVDLDKDFGAFLSGKIKFEDGDIVDPTLPFVPKGDSLTTFSRFNVNIGSCYKWTGSDLVKDTTQKCDQGSVKITNASTDPMTTGLTKLPTPTDTIKRPICADKLFAAPPVKPDQNAIVYTPTAFLSTTTGKKYSGSSIVQDASSWTTFDLSKGTNFKYNATTGGWDQSV